eukprot:7436877-Pyramimonas_sp.AAC.1
MMLDVQEHLSQLRRIEEGARHSPYAKHRMKRPKCKSRVVEFLGFRLHKMYTSVDPTPMTGQLQQSVVRREGRRGTDIHIVLFGSYGNHSYSTYRGTPHPTTVY